MKLRGIPLAISQIAWEASEEGAIATELANRGVTSVELAPPKLFSNLAKPTAEEIRQTKAFWDGYGIRIVAFQSLLFGRPDLLVFGSRESADELVRTVNAQSRAAAELGANALVFGSPRNRFVPEGLDADAVTERAVDIFGRIGEFAHSCGVRVLLEPNPVQYGCNFGTNAAEGIDIVTIVDSPGFQLHLDAAGMYLASDDAAASIRQAAPFLHHFHLSAPQLEQVLENEVPYETCLAELAAENYSGHVSVEMRSGAEGENLRRVAETLDYLDSVG